MIEFLLQILNPVQLIGYVGTACALISYQCKTNRNYFLFQMGCGIAFTVQFVRLTSWAGMLLNVFSILRGIIFALGDKCKKPVYLCNRVGGMIPTPEQVLDAIKNLEGGNN